MIDNIASNFARQKEKKEGEDGSLSKATASKGRPRYTRLEETDHPEKESDSQASQGKKIIDIRV